MKRNNSDIKKIIKWATPVLLLLVAFLVIAFVCSMMTSPHTATLNEQAAEIIRLKNEIDKKKNQYSDMISTEQNRDELNIYNGEEDPNDELAAAFFARYCTWDNGEEYEELREDLAQFGYTDNHSFINCFLPKQDITYDDDRHIVYEVDTKQANLTFESLDAYRLYVDGGNSYYAGIVQVSSLDLSGGGVGYNKNISSAYVTYTVSEGRIGNVTAFALVQ